MALKPAFIAVLALISAPFMFSGSIRQRSRGR
jgi:hypothetical protein